MHGGVRLDGAGILGASHVRTSTEGSDVVSRPPWLITTAGGALASAGFSGVRAGVSSGFWNRQMPAFAAPAANENPQSLALALLGAHAGVAR